MKGIRGRYGQNAILQKEPFIRGHLLEMQLFKEESFYDFFRRYDRFMIKPIFGPEEIVITKIEWGIYVETLQFQKQFVTVQEAYQYLIDKMLPKKFYILQEIPALSTKPFRSLFTYHRKSAVDSWKFVQKTAVDHSYSKSLFSLFQLRKLHSLLYYTANAIGKSFPNCQTVVIDIVQDRYGTFFLYDISLHERNSKWNQSITLLKKRSIRPFIPATDLCTPFTLFKFLKNYNQIILKPIVGQQGKGLLLVTKKNNRTFELRMLDETIDGLNLDQLLTYLNNHHLSQMEYLVQQGIPLVTIDDCPFDLRVITQLDHRDWVTSGMLCRVAVANYFITNRAQKLLSLEQAFNDAGIQADMQRCTDIIENLCNYVAQELASEQNGLTIIGFDIGIDRDGYLWVIEGNYAPSLSMFFGFENNDIHNRIKQLIRQNKKNRISAKGGNRNEIDCGK
ncbi:YheC/YheD family protein [Sporosarcina sp. USHLN248]|uniref:YheC/YheD family protein n=1 Tax=Sporosarcina sp. USHLN248 TaxID=3081300 RepID=UPI003019A964